MKMRKARTYAPGTGVAYSVRAPALRRYYLGSQQVPSQHSWCLSRRLYRYLLPPTHHPPLGARVCMATATGVLEANLQCARPTTYHIEYR
jgi:hypothetical protein